MQNISPEIEKEQCHDAAGMIVDALFDAGIIVESNIKEAIEIVEEELIVRKAIRKL